MTERTSKREKYLRWWVVLSGYMLIASLVTHLTLTDQSFHFHDPDSRVAFGKMVYGDVDKVDLMTGAYAEPLIEGFGFSETAFHIAIVMASRRLKSDRFLTSSFNDEVYSQIGMDWIRENSMLTVLLRHHPELEPAVHGLDNAFSPWRAVGSNQ